MRRKTLKTLENLLDEVDYMFVRENFTDEESETVAKVSAILYCLAEKYRENNDKRHTKIEVLAELLDAKSGQQVKKVIYGW